MIKNLFTKSIGISVAGMLLLGTPSFADTLDYGAEGASEKTTFTIQEMLNYAIQDEYLARAEYEKIMDVYGEERPFSNIIKSEDTHIDLLLPLFEAYDIELIEDTAEEHVFLPESIEAALEVGVQAEVNNIAMYEKFLEQELPEDVEATFKCFKMLQRIILKHLKEA